MKEAADIMLRFAERTGLASDRPPRRYLWTDAFAACNFLGLAESTGEESHLELARKLIDQVHRTLGRHREDDPREGWISGLGAEEAEAHPTRGGLRIGKPLPERRPDEPFDEGLEWERDGQYFHYLTKWMHALDQATRATGEWRFNLWARDLAETAYEAFTYATPGGRRRMYWKMSVDLSRPLVPSMGQHDPLDGFVTYSQLQENRSRMPDPELGPSLDEEVASFAAMVEPSSLATTDPLGLGGLLVDAARLRQLSKDGAPAHRDLVERLFTIAREGLARARASLLRGPAEYRLAFRELGLAIGLRAAGDAVSDYLPLARQIEIFWRDPEHRSSPTWLEHLDINEVMLATSLESEGFVRLDEPPA